MRKLNSIIVLWYIFFLSEFTKVSAYYPDEGLGDQADFELGFINAISAADIAFIMSSSHAVYYWLNSVDQSDFS